MGAGFLSLTLLSHVRGVTAPIEHAQIVPTNKMIVPPSAEGTRAAPAPSGALPSSPALSEARFRFGFLEFEDDPNAPSK
jgi:hypothetical protein